MTWKSITQDQLQTILDEEFVRCTPQQQEILKSHAVPFRKIPIIRSGNKEYVFVVAQRGNEVLYYEDVEGGFEISSLAKDGSIENSGSNQDELCWALKKWVGI